MKSSRSLSVALLLLLRSGDCGDSADVVFFRCFWKQQTSLQVVSIGSVCGSNSTPLEKVLLEFTPVRRQ